VRIHGPEKCISIVVMLKYAQGWQGDNEMMQILELSKAVLPVAVGLCWISAAVKPLSYRETPNTKMASSVYQRCINVWNHNAWKG